MIEPSIKSRPVYGKLKARPAANHLMVADGQGAAAILDMAASAPQRFFDTVSIDYVTTADGSAGFVDKLAGLKPWALHQWPSSASMLPHLVQSLSVARMGTCLHLAGSEGLIGQAMRVAIEAGMDHASIDTEHRGTLARRVQCVHCKGVTENVTTQPVACAHCGLTLLVRDHYSRRLAAFQGVCIDAEAPGDVPPTEVLFP